jgi:hypothetical protein
MALAGQLAAEPRVTLEVWHKERYAALFMCSLLLDAAPFTVNSDVAQPGASARALLRAQAYQEQAHACCPALVTKVVPVAAGVVPTMQAAFGPAVGRGQPATVSSAAGVLGGWLRACVCAHDQGQHSCRQQR